MLIDDVCFLEESEKECPSNCPPVINDVSDFLKNFNIEEYYGIIAFIVIVLVIIIIAKSVLSRPSYRRGY